MAEADRRLLVWTLASFHAAGLTVGFVIPSYASGGLSDVLPEFGTVPGIVGYAYLWALSYLATRWVLTEETLDATLSGSLRAALLRGTAGGALVGIATLLGPLLVVSIADLIRGGGDPTSVALVLAIGSGVAAVVGAAFGLAFTLIDVAAVRVAGLVVPDERRRTDVPTGAAAADSERAGDQP
jgi:hypothetical protein